MLKIIFIDTVTTGMNPEKCCIQRIGGILTENGEEKKRFEIRARPYPGARISDQSLWICGETRSSILRYPDSADAFKSLMEIVDGFINVRNPKDKAYIAGFNASAFDAPFLREWFRKEGNERFRDYFHVQTLDLMTLSAFHLLEKRERMTDFLLESVARELGVNVPGGDNYDCITNARTCVNMFSKIREMEGLSAFRCETESAVIKKNF